MSFSLPSVPQAPSPGHISSPSLSTLQYTGGNGETQTPDINHIITFPSKEQEFYGGGLASGFPFSSIGTHVREAAYPVVSGKSIFDVHCTTLLHGPYMRISYIAKAFGSSGTNGKHLRASHRDSNSSQTNCTQYHVLKDK